MNGPLLWFLNRGTGIVLLVLMTLSVVLGVLSARSRAGRGTPGFVRAVLHRNVALLAVTLLAVHVVSAVVDSYVDIRWWDAVVPWGGLYQPLWLGLGALSLDLLVAITVTTSSTTSPSVKTRNNWRMPARSIQPCDSMRPWLAGTVRSGWARVASTSARLMPRSAMRVSACWV